MNWIAMLFILELSVLPEGYIQTYESGSIRTEDLNGSAAVKMDMEFTLFDLFFIGGGMDCYMRTQSEPNPFFPTDMFYSFNAGIKFQFIEAGFRHYCMHPVVPFLYHAKISPQWEGAYEEIYIKFEIGKK